ncbi:MAG: TIGR03067 domain-containing protein, partial [Planctomycetaceae bacterium]
SAGKKSSGSNRGLIIGLSAGGGLLVIALLALAFWPEKPGPDLADASDGDNAESSSTKDGDSTSPTDATTTNPSAPATVSATNPSAPVTASTTGPSSPAAASVTNLEGDLNFLQGTWQMTNVESDAEQPLPENAVSTAKSNTWTFKDDILFMSRANKIYSTSLVSLNPTASPRTLDMTDLDSSYKVGKINPAIYSIDEETLKVCMSMTRKDPLRPREMKPKAPNQFVFTLKRTSLPTNADSTVATSGAQFDFKAWLQAYAKLKAMKILSMLERRGPDSVVLPDGLTHYAVIDPRSRAADGSIPAELWGVISSVSHVSVRMSSISDATVRQLSQHPGLVGLNISGRSTVTATGIAELKKCPNLRGLYLSGVPVSPEVLNAITQLGELRVFMIRDVPVSREMVNAIVRLDKLESLNLQNAGITDDDLGQIAKLTKLKTLWLNNSKMPGKSNVTKSKITDKGVQSLKSLTELRFLSLSNSNVTDKGLQSLNGLTSLKMLWLGGTQITDAGLAEIKAALPECKVSK